MTTSESSPEAMFLPAFAKLWIVSVNNRKLHVEAQFNPKELQIDKQIPWQEHNTRDNRLAGAEMRSERNPSGQHDLEYNGGPTRSMTIELLFDGYETKISVEPKVQVLDQMASVRDPESRNPAMRRPHQCLVGWGGMRPFLCVIESLSTKYTMWDREGQPLRATCTLKLKEVDLMDSSDSGGEPGQAGGRPGGEGVSSSRSP